MNCPLTGCPLKSVILSTIAVFVTVFAFDYVFHTIIMMPDYEITAQLWRTPEDMAQYFPYITLSQLLRSLGYAGLFMMLCKCVGGCTMLMGIRFGIIAGILIGSWSVSSYSFMPVPLQIPLKWFAGDLVQGILVGVVLTLIHRNKKSCCDGKTSCSTNSETKG